MLAGWNSRGESNVRRRVAILIGRVRLWLSKSARECNDARREADELRFHVVELEAEIDELRDRLKLSIEAQQKASEQLIAERALRQSADERADRYHNELRDDLRCAANWGAKALNRKSMFGELDAPADEPKGKPVEIPAKRMARNVAQDMTSDTLKDLLKDIRSGVQEVPVGPEFTTQ
jgi:hypothetical protein